MPNRPPARAALYGILLLALPAVAQDAPVDVGDPEDSPLPVTINPPQPRTRIEAFVARKGAVLVKAYAEVGTVLGENGAAVKVTAVEVTDATKREKAQGLVLAVRSLSGREATSWLDYDELAPLAAAMEQLRDVDPGTIKLPGFEASYRTKGDVDLTHYDNNGARFLAVRATQVAPLSGQLTFATAHFRLASINEVRQQFLNAKDLLDRLRSAQ